MSNVDYGVRGGPDVIMAKPVGPICNLRCEYCYYVDKTEMFPAHERYRMTDGVLEAFIRSFIEACPGPTVHFVWHGGEPTMAGIDFYRRAVELQRHYLPAGLECRNSLQTNGTLIDERWARFIAENKFAVGLSLDGPAAIHDLGRPDRHQRGSHGRAVGGLLLLREYGVDSDVLCTVNARTTDSPRDLYHYFLDVGVRWLQFIPVVRRAPNGGVDELSVRPDAYARFLTTIFDEWVRYDIERITIQDFVIAMFVAMGRPPQLCVASMTCGDVLAVEHDGGVYSCDHFVDTDHYPGNVITNGVGGPFGSPAQRDFGMSKALLPDQCIGCDVLAFCRGGCPKDRLDGTPAINYLCEGYRGFFQHVKPYVNRMAELARTGRPPSAILAELETAEREERRAFRRAGRNDPCPCGSGRKFKLCCLATRRS